MTTMLEPVLRFSDVAFGIDATPKALRNWLQREQVDLFSEVPAAGGWRRFPMIDVAILAIVRHLVAFGFNVETASSAANTILLRMMGEKWLNYEPDTFLMFWVNRGVLLTPNGQPAVDGDASGWNLEIRYMNEGRAPPGPAFLTLAPARIMREAFARATTGEEHSFPDEAPGQRLMFGAPQALPEASE